MEDMYPAKAVLLVREQLATDLESLAHHFGFEHVASTPGYRLVRMVDELRNSNVLQTTEDDKLEVTPGFIRMQRALEFSLWEFAQFNPHRAMYVHPFFGRPSILSSTARNQEGIFVLMPLAEQFNDVYNVALRGAASELNLSIIRGDEITSNKHIIQDIWNRMNSCQIAIADCTGKNANVFYEMGIAHTLGKPLIIITQNKEDVPFDISHIRYIAYENTQKGLARLKDELSGLIPDELDNVPGVNVPIDNEELSPPSIRSQKEKLTESSGASSAYSEGAEH